MEQSRKTLTILAILMGIIWLFLLFTQIRLTDRVFYSNRQIFQNKLDVAVNETFPQVDEAVLKSCLDERFVKNWHNVIHHRHLNDTCGLDDFSVYPFLSHSDCFNSRLHNLLDFMVETNTSFNYHQVGSRTLDSLFAIHLHDNFIFEPFQVGLYCNNMQDFCFLSEGADVDQVIRQGFSYSLPCISSDGSIVTDVLYIHFPNLAQRFHWDIIIAFLAIILLLLALLYCFIAFGSIVMRQRKINEFRTVMLHSVTHELKTPLTTINLASQLLLDKTVDQEALKPDTYLHIISEESDSMLKMIDEVLTTFRVDQVPQTDMVEVEIHEMLKSVVAYHKIRLDQCGAKVNFDFQASHDVVLGDHVHLSNSISNLIDNAIKYSKGDLVINIGTRNVGNTIEISVQDNGIGIDKSNHQLIFEPFARPNSDTHYVKGYGLGLNYVNKIVKIHKGSIKVKSELGNGATFFVTLPLKPK